MPEIINELANVKKDFEAALETITSPADLESVKNAYVGRKGKIAGYFKKMGSIPKEEKGIFGKELNSLKQFAQDKIDQIAKNFEQVAKKIDLDLTLPPRIPQTGSLHPLTLVERKVISVFNKLGFTVERGPEVENTWFNFDALNTPEWHPARDPSDTLYLEFKEDMLLRTETSPVQIRTMLSRKPPIRIIAPGRVYRNDKPDATHSPMFTQVEGLYVDHDVTFSDLKGTVLEFYRHMFGKELKTRFRPHYFPFTEPSAEVDVTCIFCKGKGCRICKHSGWIEMGGSGMVDPNVFKAVDLDPEEYTGWAFGLGIERLAMLLYGVDDIRLFYENDYRFLSQFGGRR